MFVLSKEEFDNLKSQTVTSSWGGLRKPPYAFTEQGVAMLSSVLRSERAVRVNIEIMRAFVRLRQLLASHADLARKLDALERKYDGQFKIDREHHDVEMKRRDALSTLKYLMQESGMTQADLGRLLGNRALASLILNGHRQLSKTHIRKLANYFKIPPALFLQS
jgi:antitoxin component HigA of HigAB toxin-antitoxin module